MRRLALLLSLAGTAFFAGPALAQHGGGGHGGGGHSGGGHSGGGHSGGGYNHGGSGYYHGGGGYHGGYHNGYHGGSYWGVGLSPYGIGGFYAGNGFAIGLGVPYRGYGYGGYGYGGGYYGYGAPAYYGTGAYVDPGVVVVPATTTTVASASPVAPATSAAPANDPNTATLHVIVPVTDAEVWLGTTQTTSRGLERSYQSPPLDPNQEYVYTVRAYWTEAGRRVDRVMDVKVHAGQPSLVDFRTPPAEQVPAPATRRLLGDYQVDRPDV